MFNLAQIEGIPIPSDWGALVMTLVILFVLYGREWGRAAIDWWRDRSRKLLEDQSTERDWHLEEAREARSRADHVTTRYIDRLEGELDEVKADRERLRSKLHDTRKLLEHRGLEEVSDDLDLADIAPSENRRG